MISFQSELICNIIRSSDEYSSLHDMEVKHTLAASYDVSPKITIGITKNSGKTSSEEDDEIAQEKMMEELVNTIQEVRNKKLH